VIKCKPIKAMLRARENNINYLNETWKIHMVTFASAQHNPSRLLV